LWKKNLPETTNLQYFSWSVTLARLQPIRQAQGPEPVEGRGGYIERAFSLAEVVKCITFAAE
jgi:hypothetical protein